MDDHHAGKWPGPVRESQVRGVEGFRFHRPSLPGLSRAIVKLSANPGRQGLRAVATASPGAYLRGPAWRSICRLISLSEIGLFPKTAQACAATISSQAPSG